VLTSGVCWRIGLLSGGRRSRAELDGSKQPDPRDHSLLFTRVPRHRHGSLLTRRWSKPDSNSWSHLDGIAVKRGIGPLSAAIMTETEKFRTERLVARSWRIEDLPFAMELWGDPAVTALIDSRGKLTYAQVGEKLRVESKRNHF
jgi:hypothetical protein